MLVSNYPPTFSTVGDDCLRLRMAVGRCAVPGSLMSEDDEVDKKHLTKSEPPHMHVREIQVGSATCVCDLLRGWKSGMLASRDCGDHRDLPAAESPGQSNGCVLMRYSGALAMGR